MENPVRKAIARELREARRIERNYGKYLSIQDRNKVVRADARRRLHWIGIGWSSIG